MAKSTRSYKKKETIPVLARNPFLVINEKASQSSGEAFFNDFSQVASENALNQAYDQGHNYLSKKFKDHPQVDKILLDYFSETMDVLHSLELITPDTADEEEIVDSEGSAIPRRYSFFIAASVAHDETDKFWPTLNKVLTTNLEKDGFQFKIDPVFHDARSLEKLKFDGLFQLKEHITESKRNVKDVFIGKRKSISWNRKDEYIRGVIFGEISFTDKYILEHIDDPFTEVISAYDDKSDGVNSREIHIIPDIDYADTIKELFFYECRTRVGEIIQELETINFDGIETEVENNRCKVTLTQEDEKYSFSFYWPTLFMPILDANMETFAQEVLHIEDVLDRERSIQKERKDESKKTKQILLEDNDTEMNRVIDRDIVNQAIQTIMKNTRLN